MEINIEKMMKQFDGLSDKNKRWVVNFIGKLSDEQESGHRVENDFGYLTPLSKETRDWVLKIEEQHGLNMYHSAGAFLGNKFKDTCAENIDRYIFKYKSKRPYIIGNEDKITEIFKLLYSRRKS